MGVLGVQYYIWAFSGSVLCVRTDNDGRAHSTGFRQYGTYSINVLSYDDFVNLIGEMQVFQPLRIVEHLIVDDRTKRNPGDHQQVRKQLGRFPVLISSLHLRKSGYLVRCGCAERTAGRCAVGC
jgi:hypothetical protein